MNSNRKSSWLAAGALTLAIFGASSARAFQTQSSQETQGNAQTSEKTNAGQKVLLAMATAAPLAAMNAPAAANAAPPAMASSSFNWTGFYFGVNFGHGSGSGDMSVAPLPNAAQFFNLSPNTFLRLNPSGALIGMQGGFNLQRGRVVLGAEADYSSSDMNGTQVVTPIIQNNNTPFPGTGGSVTSHQDTDWISTVRGRVGLTVIPRVLVYGTGGLAFGNVTYFANTDFRPVGTELYPAFIQKTKTGWTAGAGAEVGILKHLTVKGEYLHYDLGNEIFTANPAFPLPPFQIRYNWETTADIVRGGINFKF